MIADEQRAPSADARGSRRSRTLRAGRVLLNDRSTIDCTIRDMTDTGARLRFGALVPLPEECRLLLPSDGTVVPIRVIWQNSDSAGVAFTGPTESGQ